MFEPLEKHVDEAQEFGAIMDVVEWDEVKKAVLVVKKQIDDEINKLDKLMRKTKACRDYSCNDYVCVADRGTIIGYEISKKLLGKVFFGEGNKE